MHQLVMCTWNAPGNLVSTRILTRCHHVFTCFHINLDGCFWCHDQKLDYIIYRYIHTYIYHIYTHIYHIYIHIYIYITYMWYIYIYIYIYHIYVIYIYITYIWYIYIYVYIYMYIYHIYTHICDNIYIYITYIYIYPQSRPIPLIFNSPIFDTPPVILHPILHQGQSACRTCRGG